MNDAVRELNAAVWTGFLADCRYAIGDLVCDARRQKRAGKVCGYYSTLSVPRGVMFEAPDGSVLWGAEGALELIKPGMDAPR